jgi:hypothetical protein
MEVSLITAESRICEETNDWAGGGWRASSDNQWLAGRTVGEGRMGPDGGGDRGGSRRWRFYLVETLPRGWHVVAGLSSL